MGNEGTRISVRAVLLIALGLFSAMILIANVGNTELGGDRYDPSGTIDDIITALIPIALVLWLMMLVYLIYNILVRGKKGYAKEQGKDTNIDQRWMVVILVIVMAIGLGVLLYSGSLGGDQPPQGPGDGSDGGTDPGSEEKAPEPQVSPWSLVGLIIVGSILLFPVLRYLYGQGVFSRATPPSEPGWRQTRVIEKAMTGMEGTTGDELRDAIIDAYRAMCSLLPSGPTDIGSLTPREFADQAIEVLGWPAGPVKELTGIFELARYSLHPLREVERERALASLAEIQMALGREVSVIAGSARPSEG
jgi:heme/copper-type cytochrome/quinol oxidase subunit 2